MIRVDWSKMAGVFDAVGSFGTLPPLVTGQMDQMAASMRDALSLYDLDLADEQVAFTGLAWHGLLFTQFQGARAAGLLPDDSLQLIAGIFRANALVLTANVPDDRR